MGLLLGSCFKGGEPREPLDVLVDIDGTLLYPPGSSNTVLADSVLLQSYRLAHGALEFLSALHCAAKSNIRIGLYSCGHPHRNQHLAAALLKAIRNQGYPFPSKLHTFSVPDRDLGHKTLQGLRRGIDLESTIMVDDAGRNVQPGEERNLLKIYDIDCFLSRDLSPHIHNILKARLSNNLVRALGLILKSIHVSQAPSGSVSVTQALYQLQWNSHHMYQHDSSNGKDIYDCGLKAMQALNPGFTLAYASTCLPWSTCGPEDDDSSVFPTCRDLIIRHRTDDAL